MLFKATDGYTMVGADFSQQEPRLLAHYSGDENMLQAYMNKQDLYATVASKVYNNDYWDNMEFRQDGTANPEGKKRRGFCKSIVLGIMYQRGAASVAEQIDQTVEEAQAIIDKFFDGFPKVKTWVDKTISDARKNGYVEDLWGRRRRLPDILLPKYTIKYTTKQEECNINPFIGCNKDYSEEDALIKKYREALSKCRNRREYESLKVQAAKENITLSDNSGFIAQAERQSVNARVQGGAATMSKKAMISVYRDTELKNLGFRLLLAVHDELIGECPKENAEKVADRLSYLMIESAKPECTCPMKCDATIEDCWYLTDFMEQVKSEFNKKVKNGKSKEEALMI